DAAFVAKMLDKCKLDQEMFYEDRQRSEVKMGFDSDQRTANQMGITQTPSLVIFDTDRKVDDGHAVLIEQIGDPALIP
ncbi:DsbA family protein, partial [Mycobacterium kansasii]